MKSRTESHTKDGALLMNMGESIGSTLGAIAGRAHAVKRALTGSRASHAVKSNRKKMVKKSNSAAPKSSRRSSSRAASSAKPSARRARSKS